MKQQVKLGLSKKEAAAESSLSVRTLDYLIKQGKLKARKIGKRVVIPGAELEKLVRG
jgi:excisionase family DNA binding protein